MFRKLILFTALAVGVSTLAAEASASASPAPARSPARNTADGALRLAQVGEIEVFYDGRGNRVLIDSYTGRVIAIQPPRRADGSPIGPEDVRILPGPGANEAIRRRFGALADAHE